MSGNFSDAVIDMSDLHQHVLWGLDDGADSPEMMHAMLKTAHAQKIRRIAATPHACPGFRPFDIALYNERISEAQAFCDRNDMDITLMSGAEIMWTYNTVSALRRNLVPTLNDTDCVLIELWEDISWDEVRSAIKSVLHAGYMPIIAHVERYWSFTLHPKRAIALRSEFPVAYQVNASAVLSPATFIQRLFINRMLKEQAFDVLASDAHNCEGRRIRLGNAFSLVAERYGSEYAQYLVNFDGVVR